MVQMTGKDGKPHTLTLEASSVFDAANKAIQSWSRFWFFDPDAPLVVYAGDVRYLVKQEGVRRWRSKR